MKILLDENIPLKLKLLFGEQYAVYSVRELGWSGIKNGELLSRMHDENFHVLITMDKNLSAQQNISRYSVTIFILLGINNKLETLQALIPKVIKKLSSEINLKIIRIS